MQPKTCASFLLLSFVLAVSANGIEDLPKYLFEGTYRIRSVVKRKFFGEVRGYRGSAFGVDLKRYGLKGNKYLLTAWHVVSRKGYTVQVEVKNGGKTAWVNAKIVAKDTYKDLALVKVVMDLPKVLKLAEKDRLRLGSAICSVGSSGGYAMTPSLGYLTARYNSPVAHPMWWQCSCSLSEGNSGGPVWHLKKKNIIGLVIAGAVLRKDVLIPKISFFVPLEQIDKFLKSIPKK